MKCREMNPVNGQKEEVKQQQQKTSPGCKAWPMPSTRRLPQGIFRKALQKGIGKALERHCKALRKAFLSSIRGTSGDPVRRKYPGEPAMVFARRRGGNSGAHRLHSSCDFAPTTPRPPRTPKGDEVEGHQAMKALKNGRS